MPASAKFTSLALDLAANGYSVIAVTSDKKPFFAWKAFQTTPATVQQIETWAKDPRTTGFAVLGGVNGVEIVDFDDEAFFHAWLKLAPPFAAQLPRQRTGGGGYHVAYRRPNPLPNTKLAWGLDPATPDGRVITIETRGKGGYALLPHSQHPSGNLYQMVQGPWDELPLINDEQAEELIQLARNLDETPKRAKKRPGKADVRPARPNPSADTLDQKTPSVIAAYNARVTIEQALEQAGYTAGERGRYVRPGGRSGSVSILDPEEGGARLSYHHSSNDRLSDGRAHTAFDVFAAHHHDGDVKAAVRAAAAAANPPSSKGDSTATESRLEVYARDGGYYIDRTRRERGQLVQVPEQLTNWVWVPEVQLINPDGTQSERGVLTVGGQTRHELVLPAHVWGNRKDLLAVIGGYHALCLTSNNGDIARIAQANLDQYHGLPTARGVTSYGLHQVDGEWLALYADRTLSLSQPPPVFYTGTPASSPKAFSAPPDASPAQVEEARHGLLLLPQLVTPTLAYGLLGYGVAAVFAPRLLPYLDRRLPFLYAAGQREAGKSSGARLVMQLVTGSDQRITPAPKISPYQYLAAHSNANNLLAILDEYRPDPEVDEHMRPHHDVATRARGTGRAGHDQVYHLNVPMVVCGEGFTTDSATLSRGVVFFANLQDRGSETLYNEVCCLPLWAYASHLHHLARTMGEAEHVARLQSAQKLVDQATQHARTPRLRFGLTFIAYGLLILQDDLHPGALTDETILTCLHEGVHRTLNGGTQTMTNLEQFLEQLAFVLANKFPDGQEKGAAAFIVPAANPGQLILRPSMCLQLISSSHPERAAITNPAILGELAKQADYFEGSDTHKRSGQTVRGYRLVLDKVPDRCDVDSLRDLERALRQLRQ